MRQFTAVSGFVAAKLTGADIPDLLQKLTKSGIALFRVQQRDALTVYVWLRRSDFSKFKEISERQGGSTQIIRRTGLYWLWKSMIRRPILVVGMTLILLLTWFLPSRVFFITVEGNVNIPAKLILEKAAECGISFGANRREVRSEKMKNSLLAVIPELQWTGINTYGCTAVISVKERATAEEVKSKHGVSSIVADRDGIIYSCTVTSGNPLCTEGQAVKAGETLVSAYTDCGIKIQATQAKAEIFAQTMRQLIVKTPLDYTQKGETYDVKEKYSLLIGKKRIFFSKDSGISPPSCDKMYSQYYCILPGGFQLPIALAVERWSYYEPDPVTSASELSQVCAEQFAQEYLSGQMLSGKILGKLESADIGDAVYTLTGRYVCLEMIGRVRSEEIIKHNGQSD